VRTLAAASATFTQTQTATASTLGVAASAVTASLAVPGGPALTVTATGLDLGIEDDGQVALRLDGGTVALTGVPAVSLTGTGWTLAYNGTDADVTLGGATVAAGVLAAAGTASATIAGQSLGGSVTLTRSGDALTVAFADATLALAAGASQTLTLTGGTGTLAIDATGVAGTLAATAEASGLVSLAAGTAVSLQVNTRPTSAAGLPAGPYVRVTVASATVTIAGVATLTGGLFLERQGGADGVAVVVLGLTGVSATTAGGLELLTGASGVLVLPGTGAAGHLTGSAGSGAAPVTGTAAIRFNTTGGAITRTVLLDGREVEVAFAADEPFALSVDDLALPLGPVTLRGSFSFSADGTFAGRGISLFVGDGPAWLADGSVNPLAVGLLVTGATVGLVRVGAAAPYTYALTASGTVQLLGVPGVTLAGTLGVRFNDTGATQAHALTIPGGDPVDVTFGAGEEGAGTPFVAIAGALDLGVFGQTLAGDFAFTRTAAGLTVTASGVTFAVAPAGASAPVAALDAGPLALTISDAGVAGSVSGDVTLDLPGVTLTTGTFALAVDTTASGGFLRLTGTGITLTIAGQQVSGTFTVERRGDTTTVSVSGGTINLGSGAFVLDQVAGSLVATPAGVAGSLTATVTTAPAQFTLSGALAVQVDTAAGYLRVAVAGATLAIGDLTLRADVSFERATAGLTIAVTNASLLVPAADPVVRLTDVSGTLTLAGGEVTGALGGTIAVTVPGVSVSGTLSVQVDTAAGWFRVVGTAVTLDVLGQQLSGNLIVQRSGSTTTVNLTDARLSLAGGLASITGATASLTLAPTGLSGSFAGAVAFAVPGVSLTGTVSAVFDTAAGDVLIDGDTLALTLAGPQLPAAVTLARAAAAGGGSIVTVTLANLTASLGGVVDLAGGGTLVLAPDGVAGSFTVTPTFHLPSPVTITGTSITLDVNTRPAAVVLTSPARTLPAGPYVRAELTTTLTVGTLGSITGSFAFQRSAPPGGEVPPVLARTGGSAPRAAGGALPARSAASRARARIFQ